MLSSQVFALEYNRNLAELGHYQNNPLETIENIKELLNKNCGTSSTADISIENLAPRYKTKLQGLNIQLQLSESASLRCLGTFNSIKDQIEIIVDQASDLNRVNFKANFDAMMSDFDNHKIYVKRVMEYRESAEGKKKHIDNCYGLMNSIQKNGYCTAEDSDYCLNYKMQNMRLYKTNKNMISKIELSDGEAAYALAISKPMVGALSMTSTCAYEETDNNHFKVLIDEPITFSNGTLTLDLDELQRD